MLFSKLFEKQYEKVYHDKKRLLLALTKKCLNNTLHRQSFVSAKDYFSSCLYRINTKQGRDTKNSNTKQEQPGGRLGCSFTCTLSDNSWKGSRCASTNRFS